MIFHIIVSLDHDMSLIFCERWIPCHATSSVLCLHSCLQIPPPKNWFQYVSRVYATAINFPCIITLLRGQCSREKFLINISDFWFLLFYNWWPNMKVLIILWGKCIKSNQIKVFSCSKILIFNNMKNYCTSSHFKLRFNQQPASCTVHIRLYMVKGYIHRE